MNYKVLENEIISKVHTLDLTQKNDVLGFIQSIRGNRKSSKKYKRKAMKEIKEALLEI